jgi:capsid protein
MVVDDYSKFIADNEARLESMRKAKSDPAIPVISIDAMTADPFSNEISSYYDGGKYPTGFGDTNIFELDYWTLRARSSQLFTENLYARGLIRRLVTNVINTGLTLECLPEESVLGLPKESLTEWQEEVETLFQIYGDNPKMVDYLGLETLGEIQKSIKMEALIAGDVLIILRQHPITKMPQIQRIIGDRIQTPAKYDLKKGHRIEHGVELDAEGRQVAYWYMPEPTGDTIDVESVRVPAFGPVTGRRMAWLYYGTDKRMDEVRGQPFLSLMLQGLKEIDRYRDAAVRKAVINSILAMFIEKGEEKAPSFAMSNGAVRKENATITDQTGTKSYKIAEQIPGMVIEELSAGSKPTPHSTAGTDVNFGPFEQAVLSTFAWANEIPPSILFLAFSANYSASQAELNEFKMFLDSERSKFGKQFLDIFYEDWMISAAQAGVIKAQDLVAASRDLKRWPEFGAWLQAEWIGSVKPTMDLLKLAKGNEILVAHGWTNNTKLAREMTGTKYDKNVEKIKRENELMVAALRPMLELKAEFGEQQTEDEIAKLGSNLDALAIQLDELEERDN